MMRAPRPRNLGITRLAGVYTSVAGCVVALTILGVTAMTIGINERTGPILLTILGLFGLLVPGLISALKATEAADTAARAHNVASFTASQNAMLQQLLTSHVAQLCPRSDCPLKERDGVIA